MKDSAATDRTASACLPTLVFTPGVPPCRGCNQRPRVVCSYDLYALLLKLSFTASDFPLLWLCNKDQEVKGRRGKAEGILSKSLYPLRSASFQQL